MHRDVERAIKEALAIAGQRGGVIAGVTLAAQDTTEGIVETARRVLEKHGLEEADVDVVTGEGPVRLLAVEIKK